jgi:hypothetical protein
MGFHSLTQPISRVQSTEKAENVEFPCQYDEEQNKVVSLSLRIICSMRVCLSLIKKIEILTGVVWYNDTLTSIAMAGGKADSQVIDIICHTTRSDHKKPVLDRQRYTRTLSRNRQKFDTMGNENNARMEVTEPLRASPRRRQWRKRSMHGHTDLTIQISSR